MQQRRFSIISYAFLLSVLAYICTTLLQPAPSAQAHAFVIASNPVDGSTITHMPNDVQIYFNAPISSISTAHVYSLSSNGNKADVNAGESRIAGTNATELITPLKNPAGLPEGSYEVVWTAVARDDGHTTYGIIGFDIGYASSGVTGNALLGPTSSNNIADIRHIDFTSLLSILWDWLVMLALIVWIGIQIFEHLLLKSGRGSGLFSQARKRTYSIEWIYLWVMFFGEIIGLILRMTRYAQVAIDQGIDTRSLLYFIPATLYGYVWIARILLLIAAMIFLYTTRNQKNKQQELEQQAIEKNKQRQITQSLTDQAFSASHIRKTRQLVETPFIAPTDPGRHSVAWLTLASLLTLTFVLTSSVTMTLQPRISAVILGWSSLVAQGVWIGGFIYLAYILLPLLINTEIDYNTETLLYLLRKLTPFLTIGMTLQIFCQLFVSETSISDPQQLLNDPFGKTLLAQVALLLLTVIFTLYAFCRVKPRLTHLASLLPVVRGNLPARQTRQTAFSNMVKRLQRTSTLATITGAGMLLCTALQTFYAPPINFPAQTYTNQTDSTGGATNTQTNVAGNLTVTLQVSPERTGFDHAIVVTISDEKGNPVTDAQVTATANMVVMDMGTKEVSLNGEGTLYTATLDKSASLDMAGLWNIVVTIERPDQQSLKTTFKVTLTA